MACAAPVAVGLACRSSDPPAGPAEPSPRRQAELLVERARRDIERQPPPPAEPAGGLYVPKTAGGGRYPLLVFLHGLGGSGAGLVQALELGAQAEARGFAFIAPDGHLDYSGRRFWNASGSCCNFDRLEIDHVGQVRDLLNAAIQHPAVDPRRVYLIGYSNGGFMAYRAACELGGLLRGVVSIAGAAPSEPGACRPHRPLSVIHIHGDRDPIVSFSGGHLFADTRRPRHPSAQESVKPWAALDGCSTSPVAGPHLDLDPRIAGGETEVWRFPECKSRRVELWRIRGGDHASGLSRHSLRAIWELIQGDASAAPSPGGPPP